MLKYEENELLNAICEVVTNDNTLIAHGRIKSLHRSSVDVVNGRGLDMPPLPFGLPLKLNVMAPHGASLVLEGIVCFTKGNTLRVTDTTVLQEQNRRNHYRLRAKVPSTLFKLDESKVLQSANGTAVATPSSTDAAAGMRIKTNIPSKLVKVPGSTSSAQSNVVSKLSVTMEDVSLGGVCISSAHQLDLGDKVLVETKIMNDDFAFMCVVRHIAVNAFRYYCGCEFVQLSSEELDRLSSAMMKLQQKNRMKMGQSL